VLARKIGLLATSTPVGARTAHARGTARGMRMPITPQLDPVAKAIDAARTKIKVGKRAVVIWPDKVVE